MAAMSGLSESRRATGSGSESEQLSQSQSRSQSQRSPKRRKRAEAEMRQNDTSKKAREDTGEDVSQRKEKLDKRQRKEQEKDKEKVQPQKGKGKGKEKAHPLVKMRLLAVLRDQRHSRLSTILSSLSTAAEKFYQDKAVSKDVQQAQVLVRKLQADGESMNSLIIQLAQTIKQGRQKMKGSARQEGAAKSEGRSASGKQHAANFAKWRAAVAEARDQPDLGSAVVPKRGTPLSLMVSCVKCGSVISLLPCKCEAMCVGQGVATQDLCHRYERARAIYMKKLEETAAHTEGAVDLNDSQGCICKQASCLCGV
jgi:hypothetical protein